MNFATTTINELSAQTTVDIAPDGDVVFVIGPSERRLRVYSLFVKTASPVLKAMLHPNFEEGQQLAKTGSAEIALPEDDAEAMEIILNVIHGRNDQVRDTLSPNELLQVAITSDKYDCFVPLAFAIRIWLRRKGISNPEELWASALVACLFRDEEAFAETTSALVFNHAGSYVDLAKKYEAIMDPVMMLYTAAMLEESRNKLRMNLIMDVLNGDWHCGSSFKKGRHRPEWLMEFVRRTGNLGNTAVSSTLETLDKGGGSCAAASIDAFGNYERESLFNSITDKIRKQHHDTGGLCLWCVRTREEHEKHS